MNRQALALRLCAAMVLFSAPLFAQAQQEPANPPQESSSRETQQSQAETPVEPPPPPAVRTLAKDILLDQKNIWLAPLHVRRSQSRELIIAGAITGGVISIDHFVGEALTSGPPASAHAVASGIGRFSGGEYDLLVAGGFYAFGRLAHNERARATGVLGARAVLNAILLTEGLKSISQRRRPSTPDGWALDDAEGEFFEGGRAFPSGHSMQAWALATVVANQYRHRRWVPWVAYGLATSVALSRMPARKHFPSDVLVGSALGYLVGRYVWKSSQPKPGVLAERRWQALPYVPSGGGAAFAISISF